GLRPAGAPGVRAVLPDRARPALPVRREAPIPGRGGGSLVALGLPADRARGRRRRTLRGPDPAGADLGLPHVQLPHAAGAAVPRPMSASALLSQFLQVALALALAPLLVGWVNQCRAWLSNRSAPPITLPYRTIRKLFTKDAVVASNASPIFRLTPYVVFGAMCCAAAIVPSLATDLPFAA